MSVLASVKLPSLRRSDPGDAQCTTHKSPLLTLKLSSHSFLDCTLKDDSSTRPFYTIRTNGMTTTIVRADPWTQSTKTADIKWPKTVPGKNKGKDIPDGILVQLQDSRWKGGDSFLKPSTSKNGSRKFNLPHYSHSLKWQKQGMAYWCTSSPVKGPIAVFDPPVDNLPGRLTVYETLHDKHEASPMLVYQGVSIFLLDYLLVTVILLVTDLQEWMLVQTPSSSATPSNDAQQPNTGLQWRKIAHGEPLFRRRSPATTHRSPPGSFDDGPVTPTSQEQLAKIVHGDPLYPRLRPSAKSVLSFSSESEEGDSGSHLEVPFTRSPSPAAESSQPNSLSVSSHTYIDALFYHDQELPPVPPLPSRYTGQARPSSPASTSSRVARDLPMTPLQVLSEASRSTASLHAGPFTHFHEGEPSSSSTSPADASLWKRRPSEPGITRSRSTSRPLPRTPNVPNAHTHKPVIRRVRSHSRINQVDVEKPWLSTSLPPVPPLPPTPVTPRTPRTGRFLPPTPFDVAMGRSTGRINTPVAPSLQLPRKSFESDENTSEWVQMLSGTQEASDPVLERPSFDQPPPAYSSIDFNHSHTQS
ncbi:hypothetical protein AN958_03442 [Leucoagaricus sp. SymC.cos]|nr:hypothetical protein AN958_03442 [Leucoagaricus sp. SymC.cos]